MMPMTFSPTMPQQANPDMLGGYTDKITKDAAKALSSIISQKAVEGFQQLTSSGVPVADATSHILGELIKMSPLSQGMQAGQGAADAFMPPQQGQMPQQQQKPPQPPNPGMPQRTQDVQAPQTDSTGSVQSQQVAQVPQSPTTQQSIGQMNLNQPMNQQAQGQNPLFNLIQGLYPIAALPGVVGNLPRDMEIGRQIAYGKTPEGQVRTMAAEAQTVPLTQYQQAGLGMEQKKLEAGGFAASREAISSQLSAAQTNESNILKELSDIDKLPGGALFQRDRVAQLQQGLAANRQTQENLQGMLSGVVPQQPNFKVNMQNASMMREVTATNPKTGQRIVWRGGKWLPYSKQ